MTKLTRRSLVRGVAWSAPVVLASVTIPAYAASMAEPETNELVFDTGFALDYSASYLVNGNATNYYTKQALCSDGADCALGRQITSLAVSDQQTLMAGYGDWGYNIDSFTDEAHRPKAKVFDLKTGQLINSFATGSEAYDVTFTNGAFYASTTDPSDKPAHGQSKNNLSGALKVSADGSSASFIATPPMIHTFGFLPLGDGRYVATGSYYPEYGKDAAVIYIGSGDSWEILDTITKTDEQMNRFYPRFLQLALDDTYIYARSSQRHIFRYDRTTGARSQVPVAYNSFKGLIRHSGQVFILTSSTTSSLYTSAGSRVASVNHPVSAYASDGLDTCYLIGSSTISAITLSTGEVKTVAEIHPSIADAGITTATFSDTSLYLGTRAGMVYRYQRLEKKRKAGVIDGLRGF